MKRYYCLPCIVYIFLIVSSLQLQGQGYSSVVTSPNYRKKIIDSINNSALKIYMGNPAKARKLAENGLLFAKQINYGKGIGESFLNIGKAYWAQSYFPISLFYYNTASQYLEKAGSPLLLSDCYRCTGRAYSDLKNNKQALVFIQKALIKAGNDRQQQELALAERSVVYLRLRQFDKSIDDIFAAIKICRAIKSQVSIAILYSRLYNVYFEEKQLDKATAYCDTTYQMSIATGNNRLRAVTLIGKAGISYEKQDYQEAAEIAQKAAKLADSLGNMDAYSNASKMLYRVYKQTGDKNKALLYQDKYIRLQDSLNRIDKQNSTQLIEDYFSLSTKLHDIEQIEQKNEVNSVLIKSQKATIYNLALMILLLFVAMVILYRFYKQKNTLSKQLEAKHHEAIEQNKLIETQASNLNELNLQKDRLLAVIGHDLKSPLANVSNIVDMFGEGDVTEEEVQHLMVAMDPVIKGAELTLSSLVEWAGSQVKGNPVNITTVDLLTAAEEVGKIYKHSLSKKNLGLRVEIPDGTNVLADENHVKMILRNLLSNAIKFTGDNGSVSITVAPNPDENKLIVYVKDTGKGMSAAEVNNLFSAQTHFSKSGTGGEAGNGIGLLLCRQLVELNGGQIGVTSIPGKGSAFYFSLNKA